MNKVKTEYERCLEQYFVDVKKHKRVTKNKEAELFRRYHEGDEAAYQEIIENNLTFVIDIAKGYKDSGLLFSELISEGNMGLIHAIEKFDYTKNVKFITYAVHWIKYYMSRAIENVYGTKENNIDDYENFDYADGDTINAEFEESLNELKDHKDTVKDLLRCLKRRELRIIEMCFGLNGKKEMTLDEISKKMKISTERVRQVKEDALSKLKCKTLCLEGDEFAQMSEMFS